MRIKAVLLMIIFALVLSSCQYSNPHPMPAATPMATMYSSHDNNDTEELTPFTIFDSESFNLPSTVAVLDGVSISLTSVEPYSELFFSIVLEVNNETSREYNLSIQSLGINNYMLPRSHYSFLIPSNETSTCKLNVKYDDIYTKYGIESITDIDFYYYLTDTDRDENIYADFVSVSNEENGRGKDLTTDYLIGSDEYFDIYFVDAYDDGNDYEHYKFLIHNKSSKLMSFFMTGIAINDISIYPIIGEFIAPNSYYLYEGSVNNQNYSFLKDISKAANIQIGFYGIDTVTWDIISSIKSKIVLDETIELHKDSFNGQIIYTDDIVTIGIEKKYSGNDIYAIVIYAENNGDEVHKLDFTNLILDDKRIGEIYAMTVLPNTYATHTIDSFRSIPNDDYPMKIQYFSQFGFNEMYTENNLEFILEK